MFSHADRTGRGVFIIRDVSSLKTIAGITMLDRPRYGYIHVVEFQKATVEFLLSGESSEYLMKEIMFRQGAGN